MASFRSSCISARSLARPQPRLAPLASSSRSVHSRVPLPYSLDQGLPGFLSPSALRTVAVDWQQGVLARLNDLVRGTPVADQSVLQTLKQTAQDPTQTLAFNYASEALNNSFFLSTLSPTPSAPSPSSSFSQQLASTASLGSFPALVSHFSAHVAGLHPSSGAYVWLVTDPNGNLGVVGTYAGGTVLVKERAQTGYGAYGGRDLRVLGEEVDAPAAVEGAEGAAAPAAGDGEASPAAAGSAWQTVASPARGAAPSGGKTDTLLSAGSYAARDVLVDLASSSQAQIGRSLHPLACVSVHPHCYLEDYGLWGRDEYVRKWWGAVDWRKVEEAYEAFTRRARV
ncbi:hypothetical protein JCM10207_009148 [Rhodosporidiobolus poonsookiae]